MGLEVGYLEYIEKCVTSELGGFDGIKMLEFGDQTIAPEEIPESTGKEYFSNRGVEHISLDLNGRNGAIRIDLSKPIRKRQWLGQFDIVTNAGTSEHIEPLSKQYECFKNVHDCLRVGGIAIHIVPDVVELDERGLWKGHCSYYYSEAFFSELAKQSGSTMLYSTVIHGHRCVCMRKDADVEFTPNREAIINSISIRDTGIIYPGINDHVLIRPFTRVKARVLDVTRPVRHRLGLSAPSIRKGAQRLMERLGIHQ